MMMHPVGNQLNEEFFTEDYFRNVYREHVSDFKATWKPGIVVYYNVQENCICTLDEILEDNDSTIIYDKGSYLPLGVIIKATPLGANGADGMNDTITVLTPFFVHNEVIISGDYKKSSGKPLLKDTKNLLKEEVKSFSKAYSKELQFNIATEEELCAIKDNAIEVLNGLRTLKALIINNQLSFDDIIMQGIILCSDNDSKVKVILGGLGPDITADNFMEREYRQIDANNDYHKLSAEEFFKNAMSSPGIVLSTEESIKNNKADFIDETDHPSLMMTRDYEDFLRLAKDADGNDREFIFEYFSPSVVTVKLT